MPSYEDPFCHVNSYSPTDKGIIDRGLAQVRRMLLPHALVLHSRLQAERYHRPGVMFIIQHLVLRSARALVFKGKYLSVLRLSQSDKYLVLTPLPVNLVSLFFSLGLKL